MRVCSERVHKIRGKQENDHFRIKGSHDCCPASSWDILSELDSGCAIKGKMRTLVVVFIWIGATCDRVARSCRLFISLKKPSIDKICRPSGLGFGIGLAIECGLKRFFIGRGRSFQYPSLFQVAPPVQLLISREIKIRMGRVSAATYLKVSLAILVVSAGCSPRRIAIDKAELSRLRTEARIDVITHAPEGFFFLTGADHLAMGATAGAVGALTGGLGGFLVGKHAESRGRRNGEELARAASLQDPAFKVRDGFVSAVVSQFDLTNLVPLQEAFTDDDPKAMGEKLGATTVLDFKTHDWRLMPVGANSQYRVIYRVRSRFFRTRDGEILWQGYCRYDGGDSHATLDELTANSGILLRVKMDEAADSCTATLLVQLLGQD
jgi:hypothetical protein